MIAARFSIEPGAVLPLEASDPTGGMLIVESGDFTVRLDSPWAISRSGSLNAAIATAEAGGVFTPSDEQIASGDEAAMGAGDAAYIPGRLDGEIRNDSDEPAGGLVVLVGPSEGMMGEATPASSAIARLGIVERYRGGPALDPRDPLVFGSVGKRSVLTPGKRHSDARANCKTAVRSSVVRPGTSVILNAVKDLGAPPTARRMTRCFVPQHDTGGVTRYSRRHRMTRSPCQSAKATEQPSLERSVHRCSTPPRWW